MAAWISALVKRGGLAGQADMGVPKTCRMCCSAVGGGLGV
jgi:hypothetical protein